MYHILGIERSVLVFRSLAFVNVSFYFSSDGDKGNAPEIPQEEKDILRAEFIRTMQLRFLDGDKDFDYRFVEWLLDEKYAVSTLPSSLWTRRPNLSALPHDLLIQWPCLPLVSHSCVMFPATTGELAKQSLGKTQFFLWVIS